MPLLLILLLCFVTSCGPVTASPDAIRSRLGTGKSVEVGGRRIEQPATLRRFYEERGFRAAWDRGRAERVIEAIRGIEADGLDPADYHLEAIEAILAEKVGADEGADLDVIVSDAVASMVDDVRYGRVRPVTLNPTWNVNPRDSAAPLEEMLAKIASSPAPDRAIEAARPDHFVYKGLVAALARLREIEAAGGWPRVPAGGSIRPGASSSRIPAVRARLAATGEIRSASAGDSTRYDDRLVAAVKLFQARHRLGEDGVIDEATVQAMNVPVAARIAQVRANLERARWVLGGLADDFVLVNLPAFKAYLIRGGRNVWETRVQVGEVGRQTPSFRSDMKTVVFNPDWTVPPTILEEDVLEGMRRGEDMIARKKLMILDQNNEPVDPSSIDWGSVTAETFPYTLRQPPGEDNALGRVKFLFPNKYSIYLHDTPHQELFEAERRTFSSGCIRVEHALDLAEQLLDPQGWNDAKIQSALEAGKTQYVNLEDPLPIVIVYWTVSVGATGEVRYARDIYGFDAPLVAALEGRRARAPGGAIGSG
jgi:murein L,D-transpeptidase YcbB/YkuD